MAQIIAVASGKGGVGKSTFAAGLSAALSNMGKRVLSVDCDTGMRNLDLVLGLEGMGVYTLHDILTGDKAPEEVVIHHDNYKNLDFIPASVYFDDAAINTDNMRAFLGLVSGYDFVILDCGAGISRIHGVIAKLCSTLILVVTPEYTSIRDADRAAQVLAASRMRLVINRVDPSLIKSGNFSNIDEIIDATSVQLLGLIPEDDRVRIEVNAGRPVCSDKITAGICINNIARRLCGEHIPLHKFW